MKSIKKIKTVPSHGETEPEDMQEINRIKARVGGMLGRRVKVSADIGRKRITHYDGIICGVYPNVFTLSVQLDGVERKLTYSYNDVLTKTVMLESEHAGAV